jgi:hypothetical protein
VGAFAAPYGLPVVGCAHLCARAVPSGVRLVGCAHVCAGFSVLGALLDVPDMLPVALGHFDDFGRDSDELAATLLHAAAATLANREGHLVAGTSSVPRAFEHLATKEQ